METESRETVQPPRRVDDITFRCVENPNETVPGYYEVEGYSPYYEIHTPNSFGRRDQWNSYEHFKTAQSEPTVGANGMRLRWGYWSLPHIPEAKVTDWLLGYYQYGAANWIVAPFGDAGRLDEGLPDYVVHRADGGFVPPPADLEGLVTRALRSMLPTIKAELSLVNSLIELKDFRAPVKHALSLIRSPGYGTWWSKMLKRLKKRPTFRDVLRAAASNYLQVQFNILPLISDIRGIAAALSRTERRINELVTRSGRLQNKHWMFAWQEHTNEYAVSGSGQWAGYATGFQLINAERWCVPESTVFHAQIQYNYCYSDYQAEHARLLAHLDALGINLNPAIIWNAIPWSFVVDWVVGVSRWLDSFKVENMKPKINIHRFCWSVKRQRMISVLKGISSDSSGLPTDRNMLPRVFQTAYRRQVGFPSASSIRLSGVSQDEITLGAALVLARKRRFTRRR